MSKGDLYKFRLMPEILTTLIKDGAFANKKTEFNKKYGSSVPEECFTCYLSFDKYEAERFCSNKGKDVCPLYLEE